MVKFNVSVISGLSLATLATFILVLAGYAGNSGTRFLDAQKRVWLGSSTQLTFKKYHVDTSNPRPTKLSLKDISTATVYSLPKQRTTFWRVSLSEREKQRLPKRQNKSQSAILAQLKQLSVVVTGCCRTVHQHLPGIRKHLETFVTLFKDYKILLGESDSLDNTLVYLKSWALNDTNVKVQSYGKLSKVFSRRTVRLSYCRGSLLNYARRKLQFDRTQLYMVLDMDTVNNNNVLSQETFLSNFDYPFESWGAMSASQTKLYYDIWTLRSPAINYDYVQELCKEKRKGHKFDDIVTRLVSVHWLPIPTDHDLVEMHSAFGGFTIYQTKYLTDCNYYGYDINNDAINYEVCDHVMFNLCVTKNGGRIFINPRFQNFDGVLNPPTDGIPTTPC